MGSDSRSFVRKSFYLPPPQKGASAEEWLEWQNRDDEAARIAKSKFTRARNKALDSDALPQYHTAKVNGRYKQVVSLDFVGEGGDKSHIEPTREARQEVDIDRARAALNALTSRSHSRNRNRTKRERIRQARKSKYRNRQ